MQDEDSLAVQRWAARHGSASFVGVLLEARIFEDFGTRTAETHETASSLPGTEVDTMILGLDLCPFAQAPAQRNGLKVLSSTGCSGEDVLEDLQFEAEGGGTSETDGFLYSHGIASSY